MIEQLKSPTKDTDRAEDGEAELLLVVDQPDLLLDATGPARGIGAIEMTDWVTGLRQVGRYPKHELQSAASRVFALATMEKYRALLLLTGTSPDTARLLDGSHTCW